MEVKGGKIVGRRKNCICENIMFNSGFCNSK